MSSPKRVNRQWDAKPELCAWLRTCLEVLFSSLKELLVMQIPSMPTLIPFAVLEARWQKMWCLFQRAPWSTRDIFAAAGNLWHCGLYW